MSVPDQGKLDVLITILNPLFAALAAQADDNEASADDIIDFFALGIAAVIDNDSHITTPRDRRLAVEVSAKRITAAVTAIGAYRQQYGQSFLSAVLAATPAGAVN